MQQDPTQEPLRNINLESAILGLKMALTDEEAAESRTRFLDILRDSTLAVPTITPVATAPDGSIQPGADIQLIIANQPGRGQRRPGVYAARHPADDPAAA